MKSPIDARVFCTRLTKLALGQLDRADLGKKAAAFASEHLELSLPTVTQQKRSSDGSTKLVLALADGAVANQSGNYAGPG